MAFNFERFDKVGSIFKSRVSISRTGVISFTEGAKTQFGINKDNSRYVELYYDRDARVIGLHFVPVENGPVVPIHFRSTGLDFAAKSFLTYYGILPKDTSFYDVEKDTESDMVIIKLGTARVRNKKKMNEKKDNDDAQNTQNLF